MKYPAAIIVLLAARLASAPPPRLVREIDLNQIIPARLGFTPFAAFAFSPDENWLAVEVGVHQMDRTKLDRNVDLGSESLLLVPLNGTAGQPVQIHPGLHPEGI